MRFVSSNTLEIFDLSKLNPGFIHDLRCTFGHCGLDETASLLAPQRQLEFQAVAGCAALCHGHADIGPAPLQAVRPAADPASANPVLKSLIITAILIVFDGWFSLVPSLVTPINRLCLPLGVAISQFYFSEFTLMDVSLANAIVSA
jgi:hypothetical protein